MHRTTGPGYGMDNGRRINVDETTIDKAMDQNAIQEEICNVITHAGLTIRGDDYPLTGDPAGEDWAATPDQMKTAIFESGAIGNDAITDGTIDFAKIALPIEVTDSIVDMTLEGGQLLYEYNIHDGYTRITVDGFKHVHLNNAIAELDGRGLIFSNGPGNNANFQSARIRKAAFDISKTISWSQSGTGDMYTATVNFVTDIPWDIWGGTMLGDGIYQAWLQVINYDLRWIVPAAIAVEQEGSPDGYVKITRITVFGSYDAPGNQFTLILEYDASTLEVS